MNQVVVTFPNDKDFHESFHIPASSFVSSCGLFQTARSELIHLDGDFYTFHAVEEIAKILANVEISEEQQKLEVVCFMKNILTSTTDYIQMYGGFITYAKYLQNERVVSMLQNIFRSYLAKVHVHKLCDFFEVSSDDRLPEATFRYLYSKMQRILNEK